MVNQKPGVKEGKGMKCPYCLQEGQHLNICPAAHPDRDYEAYLKEVDKLFKKYEEDMAAKKGKEVK